MDRQALESLVNQNHSTYKIAEILGLSQTTVRYYLAKYGLKTIRASKTATTGQVLYLMRRKAPGFSRGDIRRRVEL